MDKKQILYIVIFIIICILLGYGLYFVFFKEKNNNLLPNDSTIGTSTTSSFPNTNNGQNNFNQVNTNNQNNNTGTNNTISGNDTTNNTNNVDNNFQNLQEKKLVTKITDLTMQNINKDTSGNGLRFYNNQDGKFYKISANGTVQTISDKVFFNVSNVTWSPSQNESIIEYPDGVNTYYNFDTQKQVTLPTHWEDFSFAKDGTEIAAKSIGLDTNNRWLITSDPQGKNIKLIEPMGENADKVIVNWSPNRQIVALSATGQALGSERQEILAVGLNKENYKSLIVEGRGIEAQWSPDGTKLLHSAYNASSDYKPLLWIVDATPDTMGNNRKPLAINTWASKCTMSDGRFAYCGVPTYMETGAGFSQEISKFVADDIYKIDTATGIKTIIPTTESHTINSMYVSDDGSTLYFTDLNQNGVFEIPLK
ncbi:MAG: hypothetical protein WC070_03950 [Candidatus Magasanikbacteria bacterium]